MNTKKPYSPPTIAIEEFHTEVGYTVSQEPLLENSDRFQLFIEMENQQTPHSIENFGYSSNNGWGMNDNHFFQ